MLFPLAKQRSIAKCGHPERPVWGHGMCHPCWRSRHREENARKLKDADLQYQYGISVEEFEELLKAQEGVCALCFAPPVKRALCVDHDHNTGEVRGLLCNVCNMYLSKVDADAGLLARMQEYLS